MNMPHYFSKKQESDLHLKKIILTIKNHNLELSTASGIFSKDHLDKGTMLLIENCIIMPGWKVLDLGCGIGVVGISVKLLHPETKVMMTDINERAVMISRMNIGLQKLEDIEARESDVFSDINDIYDTILINPPQTAGKQLCFRMIIESKQHLKPNGLLQLVARHNKGGSALRDKMNEVFGNVSEPAKKSGYRVYVSKSKSL